MLFFAGATQKFRAQHGRHRERDQQGHGDGRAQHHGKFAEQPPDDPLHEQNGHEHRDQRRAHGKHGEARVVVVRSKTFSNLMFAGIEAWSRGSRESTRSTASMILAPGWRNTIISTPGWPLTRPALRTSSTESCTSATSCRRTTPLALAATMTFL